MRNKESETGQAEDMLRSIVQLGASEVHYITLYNKARAEMENGLIDVDNQDVLNAQMEKMTRYQDAINEVAELRRQMMRKLFCLFHDEKDFKDKNDEWCIIKHLGVAMYCAYESYQASDNDLDLLDTAYEINKQFSKAVSGWLGLEIVDCAACLSDALKGEKENGSSNS